MSEHNALVRWVKRAEGQQLDARRTITHPARLDDRPPPWPGDTWSLVCEFEIPPAEQGDPSRAKVRWLMPDAPHEQLRVGAKLWWFEGSRLLAEIEILS